MGRKKITVTENGISGDAESIMDALKNAADSLAEKPIEIISASIKEGMCNYGYEIKTGVGAGDKIPTRKGSNLVHDDLYKAFFNLTIHLSIIDEVIELSGSETIDDLMDDQVSSGFSIIGFKVTGNEENEGFVLIGDKTVRHGVITLETPKISLSSAYPFFEELKASVNNARHEVELYMNGKCALKNDEPELPFPEDGDEFNNPM